MFRPMLYVDAGDVCKAYENFANKILDGEFSGRGNSLAHIFNVYYPEPLTVLELAETVRDSIPKHSTFRRPPRIEVVDIGKPCMFSKEDKNLIKADVTKALNLLELRRFKSPKESIEELVKARTK